MWSRLIGRGSYRVVFGFGGRYASSYSRTRHRLHHHHHVTMSSFCYSRGFCSSRRTDVRNSEMYRVYVQSNRSSSASEISSRLKGLSEGDDGNEGWMALMTYLIEKGKLDAARNLVIELESIQDFDSDKAKLMMKEIVQKRASTLTKQLMHLRDVEDGSDLAASLFKWALTRGFGNTIHLNSVCYTCSNIDDVKDLIREAKRWNVDTDDITYKSIVRVMFNSDMTKKEMHQVLEEFQDESLIKIPTQFLGKTQNYPIWPKDLSIFQCKKIESLGEQETSCVHPQQAVIYFRDLLRDGSANVFHLGSVIRTMDDPWEAQKLIREAEDNGLEPTTAVYNTLINSYVMNGQIEVAKTVQNEMKERQLNIDADTVNAMNFRSKSVGARCLVHMKRLRKRGDMVRMKSVFNWMLGQNFASVNHLNIVLDSLKNATHSRQLLKRVLNEGGSFMRPDARTYHILARQLINQGRFGEAKAVLNHSLNVPNVTSGDRNRAEALRHEAFLAEESASEIVSSDRYEDTTKSLRKKRGVRLMLINEFEQMVQTGQFEDITKRLETVMYSDYMETCHLNIAIKGMDHVEAQKAIEKADEVGLELDSVTFNTLISRAKRFGTEQNCKDILEEMNIRGIPQDNHTNRAMSLSQNEANRITTSEMIKLRHRGYKTSVLHMMDTLFRNNRADTLHVQTALKACETPGQLHKVLSGIKSNKVKLDGDTKRSIKYASDKVMDKLCTGIVRRVDSKRGFGFIECHEEGIPYCYFRLDDVNQNVTYGDELRFRVRNRLNKRKPRAMGIQVVSS